MSCLPGHERETKPEQGAPHLWIQWKGSDICADFNCSCGGGGHIDRAAFMYYVKCLDCGQIYWCNQNVELVPLTPEESKSIDDPVLPNE